jgi:hypothetical protein
LKRIFEKSGENVEEDIESERDSASGSLCNATHMLGEAQPEFPKLKFIHLSTTDS